MFFTRNLRNCERNDLYLYILEFVSSVAFLKVISDGHKTDSWHQKNQTDRLKLKGRGKKFCVKMSICWTSSDKISECHLYSHQLVVI